jgi:hypothetical protein
VGPVGHSVGLRGGVGSTFFLGSSSIRPALLMTRERLLYADHVRYVWSRVIHGPSVESGWRVGRVFPCRVYIDSNRLFVEVFT